MTRWPVRIAGNARSVTSLRRCFRRGSKKNIGYAMVPIEHMSLGTTLEVDTADGTRAATVVPMPFVDPAQDAGERGNRHWLWTRKLFVHSGGGDLPALVKAHHCRKLASGSQR